MAPKDLCIKGLFLVIAPAGGDKNFKRVGPNGKSLGVCR